ncbi:MAG TPA: hypothetical protein VIZ58_08865 [Thermoanaerobaculia bacterium]
MDSLRRDLLFALRSMRRGSGLAAVLVGILALGICANTAIFSLVRGVILRPLPYPAPDRLVVLPARHRPNAMGRKCPSRTSSTGVGRAVPFPASERGRRHRRT